MTACPSCGSTNLKARLETRSIAAPFGPRISVLENVETCQACYESGDFSALNDDLINQAWAASQKDSVPAMFDAILKNETSWAYIERVLHLDFGTLKGLRDKGCSSPAEYALLRIVATFPEILHSFDRE